MGAPAKIDPHSIAVLPFENRSAAPDIACFASGIQDEILTRLAGTGGLKVISRTSTEQYGTHPDGIKALEAALGFTIGEYRCFLAFAQRLAGETETARASNLRARDELQASLKDEPDNAYAVMDLGLVQAGLGDGGRRARLRRTGGGSTRVGP